LNLYRIWQRVSQMLQFLVCCCCGDEESFAVSIRVDTRQSKGDRRTR
jgi:hypothetical protein